VAVDVRAEREAEARRDGQRDLGAEVEADLGMTTTGEEPMQQFWTSDMPSVLPVT